MNQPDLPRRYPDIEAFYKELLQESETLQWRENPGDGRSYVGAYNEAWNRLRLMQETVRLMLGVSDYSIDGLVMGGIKNGTN